MLLDVLIPTNGQLSKLQPLLASIAKQTLPADRVVILLHKQTTKDEVDMLRYFLERDLPENWETELVLLTHLNSDYEPGHWRGYDRNYLVSQAKAKFVFMIDHDNKFDAYLFQQMASRYVKLSKQFTRSLLLSPTILRRDTQTVQSQGITGFSYLLPKYSFNQMRTENWQEVKMVGGNSLFALRELFEQFLFDERFQRSYEDIDFTYRVHLADYPVIVLNKVEIHHMESAKSFLEKRHMGTEAGAYERARNRIWFVKKNASRRQKLQYFALGLWVQTIWFFCVSVWFGGANRFALLHAVWLGTLHGLLETEGAVPSEVT